MALSEKTRDDNSRDSGRICRHHLIRIQYADSGPPPHHRTESIKSQPNQTEAPHTQARSQLL